MSPAGDFAKLQFGAPTEYGLGYEFAKPVLPMLGPGSFGHAGAGGRIGFAHPESGVAAAFVANTMVTAPFGQPDPRWSWMGELAKAVA
jgi:CubicO group peptidase (beta-lactamase class C family)